MSTDRYLIDGPKNAKLTLILAHGAGVPMDSPFMTAMARGIAGRPLRVVRFEFPYMRERRLSGKRPPPDREPKLRAAWLEAIDEFGGAAKVAVGGKSMGGRIASLIADEVSPRGLVCLGYPFHPPGKPDKTRTAHLEALRTPTLIVQGERDPFGKRVEVEDYELSKKISIVWSPDGEHSFKPRKSSGRTEEENLIDAATSVRKFLTARAR